MVGVCISLLCELRHGEGGAGPRVLPVVAFVFRLLTKRSRGKRNTGSPLWRGHL